jgi:hypothetical protein
MVDDEIAFGACGNAIPAFDDFFAVAEGSTNGVFCGAVKNGEAVCLKLVEVTTSFLG